MADVPIVRTAPRSCSLSVPAWQTTAVAVCHDVVPQMVPDSDAVTDDCSFAKFIPMRVMKVRPVTHTA